MKYLRKCLNLRISDAVQCLAFMFLLTFEAHANSVLILSSRSGGVYEDLIAGIRSEVARSVDLRVQHLNSAEASGVWKTTEPYTLVIAVGVDAAKTAELNAEPGTPILCVLIPRTSFEALAAQKDTRKFSAIYLDSPPQRQLELIRALLPQARKVGAVVGNVSQLEKDSIKNMAKERGLSLQTEFASRDSELYPVLKAVLSESDVFLAIPDPVVMNGTTAQNVLITAFRSQVPVIGYTASYVKAGALAAVYSTPQQIGQEAGQIIKNHQRSNNLPQPKYPRYFSVGVNATLMRSMNLPTADEAKLVQRLQKNE